MKAFLILEDGNVFTGTSIGSTREVISEIVFNTSMTGYLEVLTDPSDLSTRKQLEIAPDDPRWALPFYTFEAATMGWEQNGGWE